MEESRYPLRAMLHVAVLRDNQTTTGRHSGVRQMQQRVNESDSRMRRVKAGSSFWRELGISDDNILNQTKEQTSVESTSSNHKSRTLNTSIAHVPNRTRNPHHIADLVLPSLHNFHHSNEREDIPRKRRQAKIKSGSQTARRHYDNTDTNSRLEHDADLEIQRIMSQPNTARRSKGRTTTTRKKKPIRIKSPTSQWTQFAEQIQSETIQLRAVGEVGYFDPGNLMGGPQREHVQIFREVRATEKKEEDQNKTTTTTSSSLDSSTHVQGLAREYADFDLAKKDLDKRLRQSLAHMDEERLKTMSEKYFAFSHDQNLTHMRTHAEKQRLKDLRHKYQKFAWFYSFLDRIREAGFSSDAPSSDALHVVEIVQRCVLNQDNTGNSSTVNIYQLSPTDIKNKQFKKGAGGLEEVHGNLELLTKILKEVPQDVMNGRGVQQIFVILQRVFRLNPEQFLRCLISSGHASYMKGLKDRGAKLADLNMSSFLNDNATASSLPTTRQTNKIKRPSLVRQSSKKTPTRDPKFNSSNRISSYMDSKFNPKAPLITPMQEYEEKLKDFQFEYGGGQGTITYKNKVVPRNQRFILNSNSHHIDQVSRLSPRGTRKTKEKKIMHTKRMSDSSTAGQNISTTSLDGKTRVKLMDPESIIQQANNAMRNVFSQLLVHYEVLLVDKATLKANEKMMSSCKNEKINFQVPQIYEGNFDGLVKEAIRIVENGYKM